jgi:hypothetical protein
MENMTPSNFSFVEWSKRVNSQHPKILKHMQHSTDLLDRVIAKRIIQIAGGGENDYKR